MNRCVIYGAPSSEHEVSVNTMKTVSNWCEKQNIKLDFCEWSKTGEFNFSRGMEVFTFKSINSLCEYLSNNKYYVINALHGKFGEDGYVQKFLDEFNVSYSGPKTVSASITFDKHETFKKIKNSDIQISLPKEILIEKGTKSEEVIQEINEVGLSFPLIAKPNADGSSIGLQKIKNNSELLGLIKNVNVDFLIQEYLEGREFSIGVVHDDDYDDFWDLPATEIISGNELFDYESKYTENGTKEITPGNLDIENTDKLKTFSKQIHSLFKLGLYSRSDFIITENKIYFLEVNSLPGLTINSILPKQLSHVGKYDDFMRILLSI